jgi:hypothetical protein
MRGECPSYMLNLWLDWKWSIFHDQGYIISRFGTSGELGVIGGGV